MTAQDVRPTARPAVPAPAQRRRLDVSRVLRAVRIDRRFLPVVGTLVVLLLMFTVGGARY